MSPHFNPNICSTPMGPVTAGPEVVFSGKHSGICIYFSRILGSVA
jgi:nuclear pore complex protein Nup155